MPIYNGVTNQKGTPAFYSDTFANRPAFGYAGRVFISTDSGQIFEDTGTAWTLIADAGVGGGTLSSVCLNGNTTASGIVITANGLSSNSMTNTSTTAGSILFAGTSGLQSQDNTNLFWDNTNKYLGIGPTGTPTAPLDIHSSTANVLIQLNATATNNSNLAFLNAGVGKWRIGNLYNAGANSFQIFDVLNSTARLTLSNAGLFTLNGSLTCNDGTFSGDLIVSRPSGSGALYINNSSLSNKNWIFTPKTSGGNTDLELIYSADAITKFKLTSVGDLTIVGSITGLAAIFSSTITSGQITIKNNVGGTQGTVNFGSTGGYAIQGGTLDAALLFYANSSPWMAITSAGSVGMGTTTPLSKLQVVGTGTIVRFGESSGTTGKQMLIGVDSATGRGEIQAVWQGTANTPLAFNAAGGNVLVSTTTDNGNKLQVNGTGYFSSNVGIGTSSAQTGLDIISNATYQLHVASGTGSYSDGGIHLGGLNTGDPYYYGDIRWNQSDVTLRIGMQSGNLVGTSGIAFYTGQGTGAQTEKMKIRYDGAIFAPGIYNITTGSGANVVVFSDGSMQRSTSSLKYKKNIENYTKGLADVMKMRAVTYNSKNEKETQTYAGLIAEEIHDLGLSEFVQYADDGSPDALSYSNMVTLLVKAIQELNDKLVRNNIN